MIDGKHVFHRRIDIVFTRIRLQWDEQILPKHNGRTSVFYACICAKITLDCVRCWDTYNLEVKQPRLGSLFDRSALLLPNCISPMHNRSIFLKFSEAMLKVGMGIYYIF